MDRRLKERLVGATILVVLIVLIVPELLSGPRRPAAAPSAVGASSAEPVRNVTVDLATSKATPAADIPAAAVPPVGMPAATPAPGESRASEHAKTADAAGSGSGAGPGAAGVPTITTLKAQHPAAPDVENQAPAPKSVPVAPKPALHETPPVENAHHVWAVQLGSFASRANAEKLVRQLKAQNSAAYVSSSGSGASLRYRVRIGPLADRGAAERVIAKLRTRGHSASLVAP